jgi:hypothetical protein
MVSGVVPSSRLRGSQKRFSSYPFIIRTCKNLLSYCCGRGSVPYESHADLRTPPNKTVLWRYMDFAKFLEMIESQSLWFSRIDQLEDPLKGTHTDAELAGIRKHVEKRFARRLIRLVRSSRREVYVNCWRSGSTESLAMWDLYGKGSGIIAVKSTVGRLKEAVATYEKSIFISKSRYFDWNDAPGLDNVLVACSRKDLSYQHESEVRAMIFEVSSNHAARRRLGLRLPVDIEKLITEVMVGQREQRWVVQLVEQVMKRYKLPQQVLASNRLTPRR